MTSIRKGAESRERRSRVAAALAAAGALVLTSGLVMLGGVSAHAAGDNGNGSTKYFVCKYVGTPGVDEHLQPSDQNPISVAASAIKQDPVQVGSSFADAQGRSYVLAEDTGQDESSLVCPAGEQPTTVTPQVTSSDPCGTAQDSYRVQPGKFTYVVTGTSASGSVSLQFTAEPGYVIGGENPRVLHFTDVPCPAGPVVVSPAYASTVPPTCEADGGLVLPEQPAGVLVDQQGSAPGEVHLTYTAAAGYELTAGSKTDQWLTVAPQKTGAACGQVEGTETVRPKPTQHVPQQVTQPQQAPTVLGTEAFAPTAVDAGLATWPADAPSISGRTLLAQGLVGSGLVLLAAAGWLGLARRERGAHEG